MISEFPKPARLPKPVKITEHTWPHGTVPVVSIWCITYNHAKFIRDAIEGFLMQETTFPVEIFIHDDASTDGTAEIIKEYAGKYPKLFWTVLQTENQWSKGNRKILLEYLAWQPGDFIAFCEGDDLWTDKLKLQKQVKIMESDARFVLTWSKLQLINEKGEPLNKLPWNLDKDRVLTLDESVSVAMPGTQSVMLRKSRINSRELSKFAHFPQGDYPMWITSLRDDGRVYFSADCMACYRRHSGGATASFGEPGKCRSLAQMWRQMAISVNRLDSPAFRAHISTHYMWAARGFADQGKVGDALLDMGCSYFYSDKGIATKTNDFCKNAARAMLLWMRSRLLPNRSRHASS